MKKAEKYANQTKRTKHLKIPDFQGLMTLFGDHFSSVTQVGCPPTTRYEKIRSSTRQPFSLMSLSWNHKTLSSVCISTVLCDRQKIYCFRTSSLMTRMLQGGHLSPWTWSSTGPDECYSGISKVRTRLQICKYGQLCGNWILQSVWRGGDESRIFAAGRVCRGVWIIQLVLREAWDVEFVSSRNVGKVVYARVQLVCGGASNTLWRFSGSLDRSFQQWWRNIDKLHKNREISGYTLTKKPLLIILKEISIRWVQKKGELPWR